MKQLVIRIDTPQSCYDCRFCEHRPLGEDHPCYLLNIFLKSYERPAECRALDVEEIEYKSVTFFAKEMDRKLQENSQKGGWEDCDESYLIERLRQEVDELEEAINEKEVHEIKSECADVANFAMMIWDNLPRA